jgi:hypothetical protein
MSTARAYPGSFGDAWYNGSVSDALTYGIEAAVGVCCLVAAAGAWRRASLRWLGVVFAIAGLAALLHAASRLL